MKRSIWLMLVAVGCISTAPAYAHHPFAAVYVEDKTQSIEGELIQIEIRNPHTVVHVDVPDGKGAIQHWAVEWLAGLQLSRQGVAHTTLKPGDHLIITGNPSRNQEEHRLRVRTIVRPKDGWKWSGGFE